MRMHEGGRVRTYNRIDIVSIFQYLEEQVFIPRVSNLKQQRVYQLFLTPEEK